MRLDLLEDGYPDALLAHLTVGSEESRARAYELGRAALSRGMGVLELTMVHQQALAEVVARSPGAVISPALSRRAWEFLAEALAPFEMTLRGFQEANQALRKLATTLEERVAERTRELAATEARLTTLIDNLPAVTYVAMAGSPGEATWVSPQLQSLLGFAPEEWTEGRAPFWRSVLHPDDRGPVEELARAAMAEARPYRDDYRMVAKSGKVVWIHEEAAPVRDPSGRPICYQGILLDDSKRRALQEQLLQTQKIESVGRLAGGVAHDFNNLLAIILSWSEVRDDELAAGHPIRENLGEIRTAARRAAALTRQLLTFSRRQVTEPRAVDPAEVLSGLEKMLRRLLPESVELKVDIASVPSVFIDPGQLEQVIVNLVVNARDAMPAGGRVELSVAAAPAGVRLTVVDHGQGMDEAVKGHLFEPFFTTKEIGKGTGLGLATCHGIVTEAGGRIEVESEPGKGTRVTVLFPAVSPSGDSAAPVRPASRGGGERILLVEDEPAVRTSVRRLLQRMGYQVVEAGNAEEGLAVLARKPENEAGSIRLLFTDVVMPGMNGPELARRARALRPGLPVLFASGYAEDLVADLPPGTGFVQKPFDEELLARKIREALSPG